MGTPKPFATIAGTIGLWLQPGSGRFTAIDRPARAMPNGGVKVGDLSMPDEDTFEVAFADDWHPERLRTALFHKDRLIEHQQDEIRGLKRDNARLVEDNDHLKLAVRTTTLLIMDCVLGEDRAVHALGLWFAAMLSTDPCPVCDSVMSGESRAELMLNYRLLVKERILKFSEIADANTEETN